MTERYKDNNLFMKSNIFYHNGTAYISKEFNVIAYENRYDGTCDYWMNNAFESKKVGQYKRLSTEGHYKRIISLVDIKTFSMKINHHKHVGLFTMSATLYYNVIHYRCSEFNVVAVMNNDGVRVRYYTEDSRGLDIHLDNLDNYPLKDVTKELLSLSVLKYAL